MLLFRRLYITTALLFSLVLFYGCGSSIVNSDLTQNSRKVGIISISINKVEPASEENIAVLKTLTKVTLQNITKQLSSIPEWQVVDLAKFKRHPILRSFHSIRRSAKAKHHLGYLIEEGELPLYHAKTRDYLEEMEDADNPSKYEAAKKLAVEKSIEEIQAMVDQTIGKHIGAPDLPVIPYILLKPAGPEFQQAHRNVAQKAIVSKLGKLAKSLGLHAIGIVQVQIEAEPVEDSPVAAIAASGEARTTGELKTGVTMMMVAPHSKKVVDFGTIDMDSIDAIEDLPLYLGQNEGSKKLSLKDSDGNLELSIQKSIDQAVKQLVETLKDEM